MNQQEELERHFTGSKWKGNCNNKIDEETADFIDAVLVSSYISKMLKVNRKKLADSFEAWIHVIISPDDRDEYVQEFYGFPSGFGVLTWENSD